MIEKIQYFIKCDRWGSEIEYYHGSEDPEYVAESFIEDHNDHDGDYEDQTELELFDSNMNSLGVFTVYIEYVAVYSAVRKKVK